ncbi:acyltransferase [Methanobrevibacter sp.]
MVETRIKWIDVARVMAILFVVLCHCSQGIYGQFNIEVMSSISLFSKIFAYFTFALGRLGVPFFLMISGYLLLDRVFTEEKTLDFWNNKCKHLIICTIIWCMIYQIFLVVVLHKDIDFVSAIMGIFFLKKLDINHIWYMPMIIGMYFLIPFVSTALKHYDLKIIIKPYYFFSFLIFLCPFLIFILEILGVKDLSLTISLGFSGGMFGIYLISGYLSKKEYYKKFKSYFLVLGSIIPLIALVLIQLLAYKYNIEFNLWYDSIFLFLSSISLFELISRINNVRYYKYIKFLSKYSFGVFLVHNLFRSPLLPYFRGLPFNYPLKLILLTLIVVIFSYALSFAISKIPKIGKYVLYLK